ncbi:MAG: two-component regulator propeller domain-containing protein [Rhodospirillales bacterium]
MNRKLLLGALVVSLLAGGGYMLTYRQVPSEPPEVGTASDHGAAKAQPAGSTTPTRPAGHPPATRENAGASGGHAVPRSARFRIGRGNVKAVLDDGNDIWIGTSKGLIHYDRASEKYLTYDNTSGLLSNGVFYVGKIRQEIWVGTYGGGLSVLNPESGKWRNYNIPNGMADAFVYDVLEAGSGDIWIATWSGANRVLGGNMDDVENWLLYTVENTDGGLPNDWVYGLAEGTNGEIWLATEGGLARFAANKWDHWTHEQGLGAPYELVANDMPFRSDPGRYSSHHARQKVEQGLQNVEVAYNPNYIVSLTVDHAGTVWAGTWGGGLSRFDGTAWRTFTVTDGLPGNHVFALDTDPKGNVWIGTSRGLARLVDDRFLTYGKADGLYSEVIFSIEFGADGSAWFGGLEGVTWFAPGAGERDAGG